MKKRVIAWILLIGFVLLLLNLLVFKVYLDFFSIVYIIIFVAYIFLQGRLFDYDGSGHEPDKSIDTDADTDSSASTNTNTNTEIDTDTGTDSDN